jgi:diguanylate cyclase (GGDEF)-like protein
VSAHSPLAQHQLVGNLLVGFPQGNELQDLNLSLSEGGIGGDEFAILLPETDVNSANYVAQRLRRRVAETPFVTQNSPISISISLGIACTIGEITDLAVLLDCADSAMYEAKRAGRNQVCVA